MYFISSIVAFDRTASTYHVYSVLHANAHTGTATISRHP